MSLDISADRAVARIFNSSIAAAAIGAAWEVGLLEAIRCQKTVDVEGFATKHNLDSRSTHGLVMALAVVDVIKREQGLASPGPLLDEACKTASLFHWLALGSGGLFSRMQYGLRNETREGKFYQRDPAAIALACRDINDKCFDPTFWAAVENLDYDFHKVVDLGSGSGERLMSILDRYPGTTAIGVDIAGPAIKVAQADALQRGFADRISFIIGDVREMEYRDDFAEVDLLTCFLMGHDFWPRENCISTLRNLRKTFPNVRHFFLGDTARCLLENPGGEFAIDEKDVPIFTLGFEFGHAMMGVSLPTMEDWEGVFAEGGWRCMKRHLVRRPWISVIFELEHA